MNAPLVSIVTPVYNDGKYLDEAMRSVLGQTHVEFEYIVCDNHSKDESAEIAAQHARQDPRVKVVRPPTFLPQAQNFNFALRQISEHSKYVKMLLADDWIFPNCVAAMVGLAERAPNVGIVSSYRLIETTPDGFGLRPERDVFSGREAARAHLLGEAYAFGNPTQVMYRADIVRARSPQFFAEHLNNFDMDVAYKILEEHDFGFVHQVLCFSRYQEGAITQRLMGLNFWFLSRYMELLDYGKQFLSGDEYATILAGVESDFYRELGKAWLKERVLQKSYDEFWKYQTGQLSSIGHKIDRKLLMRGVARALLSYAGNVGGVVGAARAAGIRS